MEDESYVLQLLVKYDDEFLCCPTVVVEVNYGLVKLSVPGIFSVETLTQGHHIDQIIVSDSEIGIDYLKVVFAVIDSDLPKEALKTMLGLIRDTLRIASDKIFKLRFEQERPTT